MNTLFAKVQVALNNFKNNESGASLVEYSLLIGLITVLTVGLIVTVGDWVFDQWTALNTAISS